MWNSTIWGNTILAITAIAIIWYTIETRRLANLTERQIKINIKPIIVVVYIESRCLRLSNIGKSAALNITAGNISRKNIDNDDNYQFKFTEKTKCEAGKDCSLPITIYCRGNSISPSSDNIIQWHLDPTQLREGDSYELIIDYNDVEMGKWRTITLVDKKGTHFRDVIEISGNKMRDFRCYFR